MFWRIFGFLFTPVMLLSIVGIIVQLRKEQRISLWSPILGMVMAPLMLLANTAFFASTLPDYGIVGLLLLIPGLGFGMAWGQTMRLYPKGESLAGKQSILHLVFWCLSLVINQLLTTFAPARWLTGGMAVMGFSAGTTVGTNLNLLLRQLRFRSLVAPMQAVKLELERKALVPAAAGAGIGMGMMHPVDMLVEQKSSTITCPSCGEPVAPGKKFCVRCGASLTGRIEISTSAGDKQPIAETQKKCPQCGEPIAPGMKFCVRCGFNLRGSVKKSSTRTNQAEQSRTCPKCGSRIEMDRKFCPHCGTALQS